MSGSASEKACAASEPCWCVSAFAESASGDTVTPLASWSFSWTVYEKSSVVPQLDEQLFAAAVRSFAPIWIVNSAPVTAAMVCGKVTRTVMSLPVA